MRNFYKISSYCFLMAKEESSLEQVKKDYKKFQQKYGLPSFEELNQDFQIEKIAEADTELLLKEVRRFMFEKISNYVRFLETLLNPVNASMFTFSVLKTLSADDKKKAEDIYKKLMKLEIDLMEVDIEYVEEKEAEFIKEIVEVWNDVKKDWLRIIGSVKKNWDAKVEKGNSRGYFG